MKNSLIVALEILVATMENFVVIFVCSITHIGTCAAVTQCGIQI